MMSVINLLTLYDWPVSFDKLPVPEKKGMFIFARVFLFLSSVGLMSLLFVIILTTAHEVGATHIAEIYVFLLSWIGYPIAYIVLMRFPSWSTDIMFGPLDVFCKAVFALWVVQKSFYP